MDFFEITAFAHPADEVYEGQPAQIGEVEVNPHIHLTGSPLGTAITILPVLIVLILVYFVLIRPQRKSDKAIKKMIDGIEIGDNIVTIGGICGKVTDIDNKYVFIEIGSMAIGADKPFLKVEREAVKDVQKSE